MDEGYIKYQCNWIETSPISFPEFQELNQWRNNLFEMGLIGMYPNQIGFGNVSVRVPQTNQFWITGTGTGRFSNLNSNHYTLVTDFNIEENHLTCRGPLKASSESLSHGAIYMANQSTQAVFHIHHFKLWNTLLSKVPTTSPDAAYGTPELCREIFRLCKENQLSQKQILAMSGHEDGIITFGDTIEEAGQILISYYHDILESF